jgi:hypothetical protein
VKVCIVFDGPPSPEGACFIDVEDADGNSLSPEDYGGQWVERPDGFYALELGVADRSFPERAVMLFGSLVGSDARTVQGVVDDLTRLATPVPPPD